MSGKRLDEDDFINQCRKVEADISDSQLDRGFKKGMRNYCQPETAYETGRKGQKLSRDLCDGAGWNKLVQQHRKGVRAYCNPANGMSAGGTGDKYNYICPKSMERAFLIEFNKGRKKYLNAEVSLRREEIQSLDQDIRNLNLEKRELQRQLSRVNGGGSISFRYGYRTIRINENTSAEERKAARDDLQSEIRSVAGARSALKSGKRKLR